MPTKASAPTIRAAFLGESARVRPGREERSISFGRRTLKTRTLGGRPLKPFQTDLPKRRKEKGEVEEACLSFMASSCSNSFASLATFAGNSLLFVSFRMQLSGNVVSTTVWEKNKGGTYAYICSGSHSFLVACSHELAANAPSFNKSSSFGQLGASSSKLHGNAIAFQSLSSVGSQASSVITASLKDGVSNQSGRGCGKLNKVVLAYSGGLDTSVIVPWLRENYGCDVVCFTADVGQGDKEMDGLEEKAKASGASQLVVKDLKEEFVRDYIFPCLRAGALYERKYLLGTSMARPLIAKAMVDVAYEVGADAVSHGCTGKGNDQVRFELAFYALNPKLNVVAPWREWEIRGREDAIEYAKKHNVPVPVTKKSIYSRDRNLWHISHEGGILEDPANEPEKDMFVMSVDPEDAPSDPEYLEIGIISGSPVSINGVEFSPASLLAQLNDIGGKHGIGRVDMVENRLVGMKSRGVYETPGGTILFAAVRELESLTLDRDAIEFKDLMALNYAEMVYAGRWFDPLRESMDAFMEKITETTTGSVTLKLYKGSVVAVSRKSPFSLYNQDLSSFESGETYDQADAAGFIRLYGLPTRVRAMLEKNK